jgi:hypothetical protein
LAAPALRRRPCGPDFFLTFTTAKTHKSLAQ